MTFSQYQWSASRKQGREGQLCKNGKTCGSFSDPSIVDNIKHEDVKAEYKDEF